MAGVAESRTWDALLTTTLSAYRKKLIDNIFDYYPFLSWLNGKLGKAMRGSTVKRTLAGGESIVEHLLYEMSTSGGSYSGYGVIPIVPQEGMTIGRFSWRQYAWAVAISGLEERSNSGSETKMIDLLQAKVKQAELSMRNDMSQDSFGSNASGTDLDGLGIILSTTATCGGLSPTTYTWWKPYSSTSVGSFAANGINAMLTAFNTVSFGNDKPDYIHTTQAIWGYYWATLQPQMRYSSNKVADAGFQSLDFMGVPVLFDRDVPSGEMHFLNSNNLSFVVHSDADFESTPFEKQTVNGQDAKSSLILFQGNLTTNERRKHGRLAGITQ